MKPDTICGEAVTVRMARPHSVFEKTEKGGLRAVRKKEVVHQLICTCGTGHEGPHHDHVNYVQWPNDV
tara:strand:- start:343 stop:546 length:204 start_codon:yes stop_codon:yes gene_type:complete